MTQRMLISTQLNIGDQAPDIRLTTTDGSSIELRSLWNGTPLILSFLRHFG